MKIGITGLLTSSAVSWGNWAPPPPVPINVGDRFVDKNKHEWQVASVDGDTVSLKRWSGERWFRMVAKASQLGGYEYQRVKI